MKEKLKNNVRFEEMRQSINFHVASFRQNNDHFDFASELRFGALKILTGDDYFMLKINKITCIFQAKNGMFNPFQYFSQDSSQSIFFLYRWCTNGV